MTTTNKVDVGPDAPRPFPLRALRTILSILRQLAERPLSLIGSLMVLVFVLTAIFAPVIAPFDFDQIATGPRSAPPSADNLFGTDRLGRDVFSRVVWGAREIILLPGIATAISVLLGATLGMIAGYMGGWVDEVISRLFDSLLAIPAMVLALVMLATIGPSAAGIVIVIVLLYTPIITRVIRSATLTVRSLGYVEAARLRGESTLYIIVREILPGILPPLVVEAALRFSYAIFLTASLGFLGLGVQPPSPDWGRMVGEARNNYFQAPWTMLYPALAISILVIGVNLLADGLRRIFRYEGQL